MTPNRSRRAHGRGLVALLVGLSAATAVLPARAAPSGGAAGDRLALARLDNALGALSDAPLDPWPLQNLLDTAADAGGIDVAITRARALSERAEAGPGERLAVGLLLAAGGRHAEALEIYRAVEASAPTRVEASALVARSEEALGRAAAARDAWDRAVVAVGAARDKGLRRRILEEALAHAEALRDLPRARELAAKLVAIDPRDEALRIVEAQVLGRLGDLDGALARWAAIEETAGGGRESRVAAIGEQAALLEGAGRFDAAGAAWRRALAILPRGHHGRAPIWAGLVGVARVSGGLEGLLPELGAEAARDPDVALLFPAVLEELGRDADAADAWRAAIGRAPRRPEPHLGLVRLLERTGPAAELLAAVRALVASDRREPRFRLLLADRLEAMDQRAPAAVELRALAREFGRDPGVLQEVLVRWVRRGQAADRKDIEDVFGRLLRAEPGEIDHLLGFGSWQWSIGDKDAALATWGRVSEMAGAGGRGHLELARILFEYERDGDAEKAVQQALKASPNDPEALRLRAAIATRRRRYTDAEATWRELQRRAEPGSAAAEEAEAALLEGWTTQRLLDARLAELMRDANAGLERGEQGGALLADLRLIVRGLVAGGRVDEAGQWLERLFKAASGAVPAALVRVAEDLALRRGELSDARRYAERLAELEPPSAVRHLRRAAGHALASGDPALAVGLVERAVAATPTDPTAHKALADVLLAAGREEDALGALASAVALDPSDTALKFRLATLHRIRGAVADEATLLLGVVRDASDPLDVERAGGRLIQLASASDRSAELLGTLEATTRSRAERGDDPGARRLYLALLARSALDAELGTADTEAVNVDVAWRRLGERAVGTLLGALSGTDPEARELALTLLLKTRTAAAVPLVGRLLDAPDPAVIARAAAVLGGIGDTASIAALAPLATGADPRRRELAIWALGRRSNPAALALLDRASRASSGKERALAALAVGPSPAPAAHGLLIRLLSDQAGDVREAAVAASRRWFIARAAARDLDDATWSRDARALADALFQSLDRFAGRQPELGTLVLGALSTPLPPDVAASVRQAILERLFRDAVDDAPMLAFLAARHAHGDAAARAEARAWHAAYEALLDPVRGFIPRLLPLRVMPERFAGPLVADAPPDTIDALKAVALAHLTGKGGYDEGAVAEVLEALEDRPHPLLAGVRDALVAAEAELVAPCPSARGALQLRVDALAASGHVDAVTAIAVTALTPPTPTVVAALDALVPADVPLALAPRLAALDARRTTPARVRLEAWLEHPATAVRVAVLRALADDLDDSDTRRRGALREALRGLLPRLRELTLGADPEIVEAAEALLTRLGSPGTSARRRARSDDLPPRPRG
jgi:tetratricopeptide (TPR) repeat protein